MGLTMLLVVLMIFMVAIIIKSLLHFLVDVASKIFPLTFEEDFLVLPLDVTDFPTHEGCPETVIKHFGKVPEIHVLYLSPGIRFILDCSSLSVNYNCCHFPQLLLPGDLRPLANPKGHCFETFVFTRNNFCV